MKLVPPTQETVELMCTWAETMCYPWAHCRKQMDLFKQGGYPKELLHMTTVPYQVRLIRIIKGALYFDWPWGENRFESAWILEEYFKPLTSFILSRVKDIPDSVFFAGEESVIPKTIFIYSRSFFNASLL